MKKYQIIFGIVILLLISLLSLYLVINSIDEEINRKDKNGTITINISLDKVALTENDLTMFNKTNEVHKTDQSIEENMTGNNITWVILEGYQAFFKNDSGISIEEQMFRFESDQKAQYNLILVKSSLIEMNLTVKSVDTFGNKSLFVNHTMIYQGNETYTYTLLFSIGDVVVSLRSIGFLESKFIEYGEIIKNRLLNAIEN